MKNIRTYLTTAVVSLMLVVVSAFALRTAGESAIGVPLLFGLSFAWSTVKAALVLVDEDFRLADLSPIRVSVPVLPLCFA